MNDSDNKGKENVVEINFDHNDNSGWTKRLDRARELLSIKLPSSRTSFIESHLDVLDCIHQNGGQSSMNDIAQLLKKRANFIHLRLSNLFDSQILGREKKTTGTNSSGRKITEYVYWVEKSWPDPEMLSIMQSQDLSEDTLTEPSSLTSKDGMSEEMSSVKLIQFKDSKVNLPSLPEYDPAWPKEFKVEWIKLYREMFEAQKSTLNPD